MSKKIKEPKESPNPIGRPSKYKPEYCQALISHMEEGYSFESFAALANCCVDTLYEWTDVNSDFSEAKKAARAKQLHANEKLIRDIAKHGDGNATAAIFILKNCHPKQWRDRRELEVTQPANMTDDELLKEAKALIAKAEA